VNGREWLADLIALDIHDLDVILGMDWLSRYHATIDFHKKKVVFEPPNKPHFCFIGVEVKPSIPIVTTMKACQLVNKGCMAYLATIIEIKANPSIEQFQLSKNIRMCS